MSAASKVNSILQNIVDTIRSIDGESPYVNSISNNQVLDQDKHISDMGIGPFPFFSVINGNNPRSYEERNMVRAIKEFIILCTFKGPVSELIPNTYIDDIEKALAVDITRNTPGCYETKILDVVRDSSPIGEGFRRFNIIVQTVYRYPFGQP